MGIKMETVLEYVDLPIVQLKHDSSLPNTATGSGIEAQEQLQRRESLDSYRHIFEWLRRKGVKKIFEVRVEDIVPFPHSDQAILDALRGLDVEVWKWKRLDISSELIAQAGKNVKEIYLYSSGNNGVL